jgi:hypothetical protein
MASGEAGVKLCYFVCIGAGDSDSGQPYLYLGGTPVGAAAGGGFMFPNSDVGEGWSAEAGCSAGFIAGSGGTSGLSGGIGTYASTPECDAGVKYTFDAY